MPEPIKSEPVVAMNVRIPAYLYEELMGIVAAMKKHQRSTGAAVTASANKVVAECVRRHAIEVKRDFEANRIAL